MCRHSGIVLRCCRIASRSRGSWSAQKSCGVAAISGSGSGTATGRMCRHSTIVLRLSRHALTPYASWSAQKSCGVAAISGGARRNSDWHKFRYNTLLHPFNLKEHYVQRRLPAPVCHPILISLRRLYILECKFFSFYLSFRTPFSCRILQKNVS